MSQPQYNPGRLAPEYAEIERMRVRVRRPRPGLAQAVGAQAAGAALAERNIEPRNAVVGIPDLRDLPPTATPPPTPPRRPRRRSAVIDPPPTPPPLSPRPARTVWGWIKRKARQVLVAVVCCVVLPVVVASLCAAGLCWTQCTTYPDSIAAYPAHGLGATVFQIAKVEAAIAAYDPEMLQYQPRFSDYLSNLSAEITELSARSDTMGRRLVSNFTYVAATMSDSEGLRNLYEGAQALRAEASFLGASYGRLAATVDGFNRSLSSAWTGDIDRRRKEQLEMARVASTADIDVIQKEKSAQWRDWKVQHQKVLEELRTIQDNLRQHSVRFCKLDADLVTAPRESLELRSDSIPQLRDGAILHALLDAALDEGDRNRYQAYFTALRREGPSMCRYCSLRR